MFHNGRKPSKKFVQVGLTVTSNFYTLTTGFQKNSHEDICREGYETYANVQEKLSIFKRSSLSLIQNGEFRTVGLAETSGGN